MKFTSSQYAEALYHAINETSAKDHDLVMDNFVKVLAQNGDLKKFDEIEKEYKRLERESRGIKEAEITVAREMELNHQIVDELNQIVTQNVAQARGLPSKLEITKKIDESLIGGMVVRVDDTLIDASVRSQLNNLNQSLKS